MSKRKNRRKKHKNMRFNNWLKKHNQQETTKELPKQETKQLGNNTGYTYKPATNYAGSYAGNWKSCEHEASEVFTLTNDQGKQIKFYGATKAKLWSSSLAKFDLVLNVSGYGLLSTNVDYIRGNAKQTFNSLTELLPKPFHVNELILDWDDGQKFPATLSFWGKFYEICLQQDYKNVVICCVGGHGRTGTALAAILIANSDMDDIAASKLVREQYCEEAIETIMQERYLEGLYFEAHPEAKASKLEGLQKQIVLDIESGREVNNGVSYIDTGKLDVMATEERDCAWCGKKFQGFISDKDDICCSDECFAGCEEFAGYSLR